MNAAQLKITSIAIGFILVFGLGYLMNRAGKPYSVAIMTVHKLISLAVIIYLATIIAPFLRSAPLTPAVLAALIFTGLLFLGTLATGGLLSVDKDMPVFVHTLHHVTPYLILLSTSAILYLLLSKTPSLSGV